MVLEMAQAVHGSASDVGALPRLGATPQSVVPEARLGWRDFGYTAAKHHVVTSATSQLPSCN